MRLYILLFLLVLFTGCSTLKDASEGRGTGKQQNYAHGYDKVWDAAVKAVNESKLDLIAKDKEEGKILAQKGISVLSYGENVAVFVEPAEQENNTTVEVVSKRALQTNITAKNWSNYILAKIQELLK